MADDWDLHAVVRGCCSAVSSSATTTNTVFSGGVSSHTNPIFTVQRQSNAVSFGEIRDLYTPFKQESNGSVVSSFSCLNYPEEPRKPQNQKRPLSLSASTGSVTSKPTGSNTSRSKRRKIQHKKVCHVAAEALNSDVWAWRKYGQKPIKGSPYPRGYYRCSTSKGCLARKQVERNRSDPAMFIVTYTAEHNHPAPTHRNSLAGSTRQKTSDQPTTKSPTTTIATYSSSPVTSADEFILPVEDLAVEDLDGDEDLLSLSDTVVSEDFFDGLEEFTAGDSFSGNSAPASFDLSWVVNSAATTSGGI
ncbi:WRKY transcription factor 22 [Cardamine amara subsp. amara]|uniref:WRKY transcription factor 22 n=1 Tax=Cardamine amara subsp. amara TaxID=228776 RepID=A0ABD0ZW84_CARAN